jgi:hypothetical protein
MKNPLIYPMNLLSLVMEKITKHLKNKKAEKELYKAGYSWAKNALILEPEDREIITRIASDMSDSPWSRGAKDAIIKSMRSKV